MELIILILFAFLFASVYANYNMFTKLELLEEELEQYDKFLLEKEIGYRLLLEKMRKIDQNQMFEKDDDVGSVFEELKKLIEDFEKF